MNYDEKLLTLTTSLLSLTLGLQASHLKLRDTAPGGNRDTLAPRQTYEQKADAILANLTRADRISVKLVLQVRKFQR